MKSAIFTYCRACLAPPYLQICSDPTAGINKIELSTAHQLLAAATDDGFVHLWDARQGQSGGGRSVASLDLRNAVGPAVANAAEKTLGGFQVMIPEALLACTGGDEEILHSYRPSICYRYILGFQLCGFPQNLKHAFFCGGRGWGAFLVDLFFAIYDRSQ